MGTWRAVAAFEMEDMAPHIEALGIDILPLTGEIADASCDLPWQHRDPFDRMIAATAKVHDLALVSEDAAFDTLSWGTGYRRVWD